jgi:putative ABC transport system permease protein
MWRNNLKIALRALKRRPGPALINVLGLAVGLAACVLIALWVNHELSYDDFHPGAERIHRIALDVKLQDREITGPITAAPLARTLIEDRPEVETATRFGDDDNEVFRVGDRTFAGHTVLDADSLFFEVFGGFDFLHGNRASALKPTDAIVLTASTAERLFGTTNAVGQTLERGSSTQRVTGVIADVPDPSHMHFDAVASDELSPRQQSLWVSNNWYTYAKLAPGASPDAFEQKVNAFVQKYVAPQIQEFLGMPFNQLVEQGARYRYFTQPLPSIHLYSNYQYELEPNGSIAYVYTFSAIALFILLIACVNFMNLATARASERATEVGMRKALGAYRTQLAGQFLGEATLTTGIATALSLGLALLALPVFNDLAGTSISPWQILQPSILLGGVGLIVAVGLVAGSYPAFVLSHFQPATVLKSDDRHSTSGHGKRLRQGLVVLQFTISIVLIIGTLVVQQQFAYIQDKRLGIDKEQVITVDRAWTLEESQTALADRVSNQPGIVQAATADGIFRGGMSNNVFVPDDAPASESYSLNYLNVGFTFVETLGIEVVAGRTFSPERPADSSAVLINRAAADVLGWDDPTGHQLREPGEGEGDVYDVIGVVDNFHYASMRQEVRPLVLRPDDVNSTLYVRTAPGAAAGALDAVRQAWSAAAPEEPLQYTFLDQTYGELHRDTQRTGRLFTIFAVLAIAIACLGLYGLATHTAQRRTKEIGIRKALGATATQIVGLLSKEFLQLVGLAFFVALPVAYLSMDRWLQDFAYRMDLGVPLFVLAGVLAATVAFLTVSYQAIRAAQTNPANTLHGE